MPLNDAINQAPTRPGVYVARSMSAGAVCYVGMAGERRGKGVRGRLLVYATGKGLASGLREASFDRALRTRTGCGPVERGRVGKPGASEGLGSTRP